MINNNYIVGFFGSSGSGKGHYSDLLFNRLVGANGRFMGRMVSLRSMATPMKKALAALGISKGHQLFRHYAQGMSDLTRGTDQDFHVNLFKRDLPDGGLVIIDDGRYPNEAEVCDLSIVIRRDEAKAESSQCVGGELLHDSETSWLKVVPTMVIHNRDDNTDHLIGKIIDAITHDLTESV